MYECNGDASVFPLPYYIDDFLGTERICDTRHLEGEFPRINTEGTVDGKDESQVKRRAVLRERRGRNG